MVGHWFTFSGALPTAAMRPQSANAIHAQLWCLQVRSTRLEGD
jgi:hypothetical protein